MAQGKSKGRDFTGWILLAAAIGVGGLAFFLVRGYLTTQAQQIRLSLLGQQAKTERVVVASRNLVPGDVISSATMAIGELRAEHVPGRAVLPGDFDRVKNRVINRPMSSGEPLLADFVAGLIIERFSDLLEDGQRAVSLEVAPLQTSSGMLLPGDYVDLFVLLKPPKGSKRKLLKPVLRRIKVLAAGQEPLRARDQSFERLDQKAAGYRQISVGVALADAKRLVLARDAGDIVYLLRNAKDKRSDIATSDLYGLGGDNAGYLYISSAQPAGQERTALGEQTPLPTSPLVDSLPTDAQTTDTAGSSDHAQP